MKVRCHREGLLSAVQLASAAVPSRDLKPVLKNIKIVADGDRCTQSFVARLGHLPYYQRS